MNMQFTLLQVIIRQFWIGLQILVINRNIHKNIII